MKKWNLGVIIVIMLILIIILITITILIQPKKEILTEDDDTTIIIDKTPKILQIRNDFFSMEYCAQKYFQYLANKNDEAISQILDEQYQLENEITSSNLEYYGVPTIYKANMIYVREETTEKAYYYIYGTIREDTMDERALEKQCNITVIIDRGTFSIIPNIDELEQMQSDGGE